MRVHRSAAVVFAVLVGVSVLTACADSTTPTTGQDVVEPTRDDFETIDFPGAAATIVNGINGEGDLVGLYRNAGDDVVHSFVTSNGEFETIDVPGARATFGAGINDSGVVVGDYLGADGASHGFRWTAGRFETIDAPGALDTYLTDINDSGEVTGIAYGDQEIRSFVFGADGFTPLRGVDGATTFVNGISSDGRVVGVVEVPMSQDMISPPKRELSFVTATPVAASIPGVEGEFVGDRFVILAEDATIEAVAQTQIEMRAANTGPLRITRMRTVPEPAGADRPAECTNRTSCLFDGFENTALGGASLSLAEADGAEILVVDGIGAEGADGVAQAVPRSTEMQTALLTPNFSLSEDGTRLVTTQVGLLRNNREVPFSTLEVVNVGMLLEVKGDWSAIGTTRYTIEVYDGGELVTSQPGRLTGEITILDKPDIDSMTCSVPPKTDKRPWVPPTGDVGNDTTTTSTFPEGPGDPGDIFESRFNEAAYDVNTAGTIVGQYYLDDPDEVRGFLLRDGRPSRFDIPDARVTGPVGINDDGTVVGFYEDANGVRHGFVWKSG